MDRICPNNYQKNQRHQRRISQTNSDINEQQRLHTKFMNSWTNSPGLLAPNSQLRNRPLNSGDIARFPNSCANSPTVNVGDHLYSSTLHEHSRGHTSHFTHKKRANQCSTQVLSLTTTNNELSTNFLLTTNFLRSFVHTFSFSTQYSTELFTISHRLSPDYYRDQNGYQQRTEK